MKNAKEFLKKIYLYIYVIIPYFLKFSSSISNQDILSRYIIILKKADQLI